MESVKDIGPSPDWRSMSPHQKQYEIVYGEEWACPWCEESLDLEDDLVELFMLCIRCEFITEHCRNCGARLEIEMQFVSLTGYRAELRCSIEAEKRVA